METYTKEFIQNKLSTDVKWIERTLVVLYEYQTEEEKEVGGTIMFNGVGFNGVDGRFLTKCSKWVINGRHLSGYHLDRCKRVLPKYWRQIQQIIRHRQQQTV